LAVFSRDFCFSSVSLIRPNSSEDERTVICDHAAYNYALQSRKAGAAGRRGCHRRVSSVLRPALRDYGGRVAAVSRDCGIEPLSTATTATDEPRDSN
jgi:hypothetical protein